MRRYLIVSIVILVALAVAWPVLGQREGRESRQALSEEQRTRLRERWQNMSEEERQQLRNQMRERTASRGIVFGREEQLKVIEGIEEQLAKLKEAIKQAPDREELRKLPEASPEAQAKLREEWQKTRQEQQQMVSIIKQQLTKLEGPRSPTRIERPGLFLNELKAIHETAIKENAEKTAKHIERLITRYQIRQEERQAISERPGRLREQETRLKKAPDANQF